MASKDAETWALIHEERRKAVQLIGGLTPEQLGVPSLCAGWDVHTAAAHILLSAEQTPSKFFSHLVRNGLNFNKMIDRDSRALASLPVANIADRLQARTTTTNKAPAPTVTMLGEMVVHSEDIRRPLGIAGDTAPQALVACLDMYVKAGFPVGSRQRVAGLRLASSDVDWTHGDGPTVTGPAMSLIMAITGRPVELSDLSGDGVVTLKSRLPESAT